MAKKHFILRCRKCWVDVEAKSLEDAPKKCETCGEELYHHATGFGASSGPKTKYNIGGSQSHFERAGRRY